MATANFVKMLPILGRFPKKIEISNSEIQTFKRCRRRWMLGTYYGLQAKDTEHTGPLPLGTRIHNALEAYYTTGENPVDAYNKLQRVDAERFADSKKGQFPEEVKKFNSESELGRLMVEGYIDWMAEENPDADIKVVSAEQKIEHLLKGMFDDRVSLIGKLDLQVLRTSDDTKAVFDHKSALTFNDYLQYSQFSEQLMHYTMLENLNSKEGEPKVDGGIYNLLKKVKRSAKATPPFYMRIDVRFNRKAMASFWLRTLGTIRDIMYVRDALDNGEDHRYVAYPTQKMDWSCGTCPFAKGCYLLDDGSYAEGFFTDLFNQVDPNARYEETNEKES